MQPTQIQIVRTTFAAVAPQAGVVAQMFYERLFELRPCLRLLFRDDMAAQGHRLMQVLGTAVSQLDRLPELRPVLQQLGRRHTAYGVEDEDYEVVGQALLWTLQQGLGERFTSDVRDAWAAAYTVLAGTMRAEVPA
jgi:hemoglobin-like flavoprotein